MDLKKAISNLTDVLIDDQKYEEVVKSLFVAVDVDNVDELDLTDLKKFIAELLRGLTGEKNESSNDMIERYKMVFANLDDHVGDFKLEDLSKFLRELLKLQIKDL